MFLIKICGLTSVPDAFGAMDAGADAVGLNFFSQSKRRVDVGIAREICAELPKSVLRVGVFVNHEPHEILEIVARVGLDLVQLHGDERPGVGSSLSAFPVLRAVRCRGVEDVPSVVAWVNAYRDTGGNLAGLLADAFHPGEYGGTGQRADVSAFAELRRNVPNLPLVLAGGLTPANVADAIDALRPDGVDTASGVELSPGVKDREQMRRFVAAAQAALARIRDR